MSQKRKRSLNWEEAEKVLLKAVLRKYATILGNKSLKTNTNKAKSNAWNEVLREFNEHNCRPRVLSQIQTQWKAMKMNARRSMSDKRESNVEDGTESPSPSQETIDVAEFLDTGELNVDYNGSQSCDYNQYDSDGIPNTNDYPKQSFLHNKILKNDEHEKLMAMAVEEHQLKVKLLKEQIKCAELQTKTAELDMSTAHYNNKAAKTKWFKTN